MTDSPEEPRKNLTEARQRDYPKLPEEAQARIAQSLAQSQAADRERAQARREEFIAAILDFCREHAVEPGDHAANDQHERAIWLAMRAAFADKWQAVLLADRYTEVVAAMFKQPESTGEPWNPPSDPSPKLSKAVKDKLVDFVNATPIHEPERAAGQERAAQDDPQAAQ